jgi:hypothetical protein
MDQGRVAADGAGGTVGFSRVVRPVIDPGEVAMVLKRFLPVVSRELREASRQRATYWNRVVAVSVALMIFYLFWLSMRQAPAHELGKALFYSLSALAGLICLMAGSGVTDSISREKREGTLGLLFLTNLSGYDVVAGKISAGSLGAAYRVISILPIMAMGFLFGGVEVDMYVRVVFACANSMLLSLAIAVYWSSRLTTSWACMLAWLGTMVFLVIGLPFLLGFAVRLIPYFYVTQELLPFYLSLFTVSPGFTAVMAVGPKMHFGQFYYLFWISLLVQHLLAWRAFQLASKRTQNVWHEQELQLTRRNRGRNLKDLLKRLFHWLRWRHRPVHDEAPITWLVRRSRLGLNVTLAVFALTTLAYTFGWFADERTWRDSDLFSMMMTLMHLWLLGWMAGEAATWIFRDRQSGAMELILATPLKVRDILKTHFQGINKKLLWPVLWVVAADVFFMLHDRTYYHGVRFHYFKYIVWGALIVMLLFNLYVLRWTATWLGLISRNEFNAAIGGLIWLSLPTWGIIVIGTFTLFLLSEVFKVPLAKEFSRHFEEWHFLLLWFVLGTINNLVMLWISRRECLHMREYATLRPDNGFWAQMKYVLSLFQPRTQRE